MSFIGKRLKAFTYAFQGIAAAIRHEAAFKVHLAACFLVSFAGFFCGITAGEWCIVVTCCAIVLITELINTAIETICDKLMPERNENVKFIKDVSAAAVLIAAIVSVIMAIIIFYPYFKQIISGI